MDHTVFSKVFSPNSRIKQSEPDISSDLWSIFKNNPFKIFVFEFQEMGHRD